MAVSSQRSAASLQILPPMAASWSLYKIMGPLKKASVYQLAVGSQLRARDRSAAASQQKKVLQLIPNQKHKPPICSDNQPHD
jgi:hypothetical protein